MNLFYATDIVDDRVILPDEEARHAVQVLRKKPGDEIYVIDGKGHSYQVRIEKAGKKACQGRILQTTILPRQLQEHVHIGIAPTKNINRFEWFLEKATEIGISEITPLICQHSERKTLRMDRMQKILIAAMKQSLKSYLPQLNALSSFNDFIKNCKTLPQHNFIAFLGQGVKGHLINNYPAGQDVAILIGPEGDFSLEEIELALSNDFIGVSLGESRLRTETAGIAACHIVNLVNQK